MPAPNAGTRATNPAIDRNTNANFCGKWRNAGNTSKSEAEIVALWNEAHPGDPIETGE